MAIFTKGQGARSAAVITMGTLASATYIAAAYDLGAAIPEDVTFEVEADPNGTPSGNRQLVVFVKFSLDNLSFGSGPESGTDAAQEGELHWVGNLPCPTTNVARRFFSLAGLPVTRYGKLVIKNDCGVALTSGAVYKADITGVGT